MSKNDAALEKNGNQGDMFRRGLLCIFQVLDLKKEN
jgi:hypothetical protein